MSSSTWEVLQIPSTKAPSLRNCSIACSLARAACLQRVKVRFHSNPCSKPRVESFPERPVWKIFGRAESLDHPAVSIPKERLSRNGKQEVIAAAISGSVQDGNQTSQLDAILVADLDFGRSFYNIRSQGPDSSFPLGVDNVTFSLNLIDRLAGENSLLDIRNRRRQHGPWWNSRKTSKKPVKSLPTRSPKRKNPFKRFFRKNNVSSTKLWPVFKRTIKDP